MGEVKESKNIWAYASPYIFKEVSYSQEEENQADDKDDIRKERTKNPLPVYGFRAKTHAVDYACANRPHQQ